MPSPTISYLEEIQTMMYAAGDCKRPLSESAVLVEEIVYRQMIDFIHQAQSAAEIRGQQYFDSEDIIYVLRQNPRLLNRIIQKLKAKDYSAQTSKAEDDDEVPMDTDTGGGDDNEDGDKDETIPMGPIVDGKRMKFCKKIIDKIDPTGQLFQVVFSDTLDNGKKDRLIRISNYAASMDADEYVRFTEARQVSFTKSFISTSSSRKPADGCASVRKFREWLFGSDPFFEPEGDHKPNPMTMEILNILAYEILAVIMDCVFMVKRETAVAGFGSKRKIQANDGNRATQQKVSPLYATSSSQQTALLLSQKLRSKPGNQDVQFGLDRLIDDAIQPWEIREAVRRLRFAQNNSPHTLFENETTMNRVIF